MSYLWQNVSEVEFLNRPNQSGQPGSGGQGGATGMMPPMTPMGMMMPGMTAMQPEGAMTGMPMGAPGSGLQRLLTNMFRVALRMRQFFRSTAPLPMMEEPCPCDADCCSRPMEARRVLPVFELPMTTHVGCCGCVECPLSLSPMVANMISSAQEMSSMPFPGMQRATGGLNNAQNGNRGATFTGSQTGGRSQQALMRNV